MGSSTPRLRGRRDGESMADEKLLSLSLGTLVEITGGPFKGIQGYVQAFTQEAAQLYCKSGEVARDRAFFWIWVVRESLRVV